MTRALRLDLFCKVIDNFGDAGVSWRLARLLAAEHGAAVTLWLDQLEPLTRMAPGVDAARAKQHVQGVTLRQQASLSAARMPADHVPADAVIDAFGTGVPEAYVEAMARRPSPPPWFILEYLSAEAWIEDAHGRASPHPRLPLVRRFWFPGFTAATGGLPRERGLFAARDAFQVDRAAQDRFWTSLGMASPAAGETRLSLFCYPHPSLSALFDAWADGDGAVVCVMPEGVAAGALDAWTRGTLPHAGGPPLTRGRLRLHVIPFLAQDDYDRLLWASDCNVVRGEDSFVRAQYAARPFVWHLYPQADDAHLPKLAAFLDRYARDPGNAAAHAARGMFGAWNGAPGALPLADAWREFAAARPDLATRGRAWAAHLESLPELADGLVKAVREML